MTRISRILTDKNQLLSARIREIRVIRVPFPILGYNRTTPTQGEETYAKTHLTCLLYTSRCV